MFSCVKGRKKLAINYYSELLTSEKGARTTVKS